MVSFPFPMQSMCIYRYLSVSVYLLSVLHTLCSLGINVTAEVFVKWCYVHAFCSFMEMLCG